MAGAPRQNYIRFHPRPRSFPPEFLQARWYAAQTCANHEKRIQEQLHLRTVESYLPVYASVRRWKDRSVRLALPLFPGYVFVRLALRDRLQVLQTPSVVRLVGFGGQPTPLANQEIDALRQALAHDLRIEPHAISEGWPASARHRRSAAGP